MLAEDWLNLGGTVRGLVTGKEAPSVHMFLETNTGDVAASDVASFALGALLRGYTFKKYKTKSRKKDSAAGANDRSLKKIVIHCADPKAATGAFAPARAIAQHDSLRDNRPGARLIAW